MSSQRFLISVPEERGSGECGDFDLLFHEPNGQTIETRPFIGVTTPTWSIEIEESSHQNQIVELQLTPHCAPSGSPAESTDREAVKVTILSVDGRRVSESSVFYVQIERQESRIIDILGGQHFSNDLTRGHGSPLPRYSPINVGSENTPSHAPHFRDEGSDNATDQDENEANETQESTEEVDLVQEAVKELQSLRDRLEEQRKVVEHLTGGEYSLDLSVIEDCDSWACVVQKLLHKGKNCIHGIYVRVVTFIEEKRPSSPTMTTFSSTKQMKLSMDTTSVQDSKMAEYNYTLLPSIKEDYESETDISDNGSAKTLDSPSRNSTRPAGTSQATGYFNQAPTRHPYVPSPRVYAALGGFLSLACLGCLRTFLHRRCCNPRAKADRAARREELQNQREYARAARKHAWKDWWAKKFGLGCCLSCGGRRDKRIGDYEEKRALITQQEDRLEVYMQEEIRFLTHNATEEGRAGLGSRVSMPSSARRSMYESSNGRSHRHATRQSRANTGGSDSSTGGSLPSYRSRDSSSSGRPPSYRTRASSLVQPRLIPDLDEDLASRVAHGFPYVGGTDHVDWASDGDDETPDSSVVDVSPRLSSETIRTERSAL